MSSEGCPVHIFFTHPDLVVANPQISLGEDGKSHVAHPVAHL